MLGPDGSQNNMGGTAQILYYASAKDILTYAKPATNAENPYVNTQAFVMKSGKKFFQLYCTIDTSELESGSNGDIDGKSFKPTVKMFYPGLDPDTVLFINKVKNDKLVVIVPLPNGTMVQLGEEKFFVYASPNFKTGATSGRGQGNEFEFMCYQPNILLYAASVPLTPAA